MMRTTMTMRIYLHTWANKDNVHKHKVLPWTSTNEYNESINGSSYAATS